MPQAQAQKAAAFQALHAGDPFVIPNPWDAGSARVLEELGFKALATTSSGFAFTLGRPDGQVTLDEVAAHVRLLCEVTGLPVSVDLEAGYDDPAEAIRRVAEAGAVGGSIEDSPGEGVYPVEQALERLGPAIEAARSLDFPFTLTARAENHIRGNPDLDDTIARLQAYEQAGADVIYAPGLREVGQIRAIRAATTKPINVLGHRGFSLGEIVAAGAQRVSVGGALTWAATAAFTEAAERIRDEGDFSLLTGRAPLSD
jgi:2-methylisocitrate lyase-like PEP mutase family enzyme